VSSTAQVALLPPQARRDASARLAPVRVRSGAGVRLASFAALALFGTLSWSRLLSGSADERRLLGMLALAVVLAAAGMFAGRWRRPVLAAVAVVGLLVSFALAGVPVSWIVHVRIAVTLRVVGDGLQALPGLLVPYLGINSWVRMVMMLGAAVLLLDATILFALAPRSAGLARRGVAALPLIALATIPDTVVHPRFAYVDGVLLFVLLAGFLWADRIDRYESLAATGLCALAGAAAMVIAPGLDRHRPWINYQALASKIASGPVAHFDWAQTYGPITWPRTGQTVLDVAAQRGDYWKTENLDAFDGRAWTNASVATYGEDFLGVSARSRRRWTQTLQVTLAGMQSSDVIGAGIALAPPEGLQTTALTGSSPGTWTTQAPLARGDSYLIRVYDPEPSAAQLAAAGTHYPQALLTDYLTVTVPAGGVAAANASEPPTVNALVPPFGSPTVSGFNIAAASVENALSASPYAPAYRLARRLASQSATPYAYVLAVERYLAKGFRYDENVPGSRYPLESFLFQTKAGYCQQFAGALALLLRLGGVPARVAVGFTTGLYDSSRSQWVVRDSDAQAWVEAFFPGYGWVKFDATPPADPALRGAVPGSLGSSDLPINKTSIESAHHLLGNRESIAATSRGAHASSGWTDPWLLAILALALAGGAAIGLSLVRPPGDVEAKVAELERAFTRTGRPLEPAVTLASLEGRFAGSPKAGAYIRALALQRYAGSARGPTLAQRRALRKALRLSLGFGGMARAWWALPPRRRG
jgi:hypothetical protein